MGVIQIPGYRIRSRLGWGGQALVYLAEQESLGRSVALKVLHPVHSQSAEFTTRFLNEGRILADLNHANVITIHDIGVVEDLHYLSMELVEGGDLKDRIAAGMDPQEALTDLEVICRCLAAAHEKSIVHRDIKPGNVLFRGDGTLLLSDFGIAKRLDADGDLTVSGTTLGSPNYLSPEQAQGRPLDGRADLYSLGAMAFEMLTGKKPYAGRSEIDTIFAHINAPVPRLPDRLSRYQRLIERSMAKAPEDRYPDAWEMARDLHRLRDAGTLPALPGPLPPRTMTVSRRSDLTTELELVAITDGPRRPRPRSSLGPFAAAALMLAGAWWSFTATDAPEAPPETDARAVASNTTPTAAPRGHRQEAAAARSFVALAGSDGVDHESVVASIRPASIAPSTTVAPSPRTGTTPRVTRIDALLRRAERALSRQQLARPGRESAYDYYQAVLELDSDNPTARDGLEELGRRYGALAQRAMARNDMGSAAEHLRRGLAADHDSAMLLALQARLSQPPPESPDPPTSVEVTTTGSEDTPAQLLNRVVGFLVRTAPDGDVGVN